MRAAIRVFVNMVRLLVLGRAWSNTKPLAGTTIPQNRMSVGELVHAAGFLFAPDPVRYSRAERLVRQTRRIRDVDPGGAAAHPKKESPPKMQRSQQADRQFR